MSMGFSTSIYHVIFLLAIHLAISTGEDTLSVGQLLRTNQTLTSTADNFALGFFDFGNSTRHLFHLAIWYNRIPGRTIAWVANRNVSLTDANGGATISSDGNLVILDGNSTLVWSSNALTTLTTTSATRAVIEESGNLAFQDDQGSLVWQSFDFPSDTMLPGMILRFNLTTGLANGIVSWKSPDDPSPGNYYFGPDPQWPMQLLIVTTSRSRSIATPTSRMWRSVMWINQISSYTTPIGGNRSFVTYLTMLSRNGELTWTQSISDASMLWQFHLNSSGVWEMRTWAPELGIWEVPWYRPQAPCWFYGFCGPNAVCHLDHSPLLCSCLTGFRPIREAEWNTGNWSAGCVRDEECAPEGDGFFTIESIKLPDFPISMPNLSEPQCADTCLRNCSCTAYSFANVSLEPCLLWAGNLLDLVDNITSTSGQDLHIRLSIDQLNGLSSSNSQRSSSVLPILVGTLCGAFTICAVVVYLLWRRHKNQERGIDLMEFNSRLVGEEDVPMFRFSSLQAATKYFSDANKLGEGGFGSVYEGKLATGEEIAVKRLAQSSGQGLEEFKTEVELIAKLQHRNLVRLLGWCKHKEEKLLIYEFMPNKSLDKILFAGLVYDKLDPASRVKLDWEKRLRIAEGIAQGLLYLHKHSRFKIVHRDLKPSNILLDGDMKPKISDFGMARIVEGNRTAESTQRVVGTLGYMSPEYALHGVFSEKSDVYSFGVILLELVSGKRASGVYPLDHSDHLLGYAWTLWAEDRHLDIIDPCLSMTEEVARCIHIALLCVQEGAAERPSISSVVFMLSSENSSMPLPKEPAFCMMKSVVSTNHTSPLVCASIAAQDPFLISSSYYDGR